MATIIASEKATDMAKMTEIKQGQGNNKEKWNVKNNKTAY